MLRIDLFTRQQIADHYRYTGVALSPVWLELACSMEATLYDVVRAVLDAWKWADSHMYKVVIPGGPPRIMDLDAPWDCPIKFSLEFEGQGFARPPPFQAGTPAFDKYESRIDEIVERFNKYQILVERDLRVRMDPKIQQLNLREGQKFDIEYDFGSTWRLHVLVGATGMRPQGGSRVVRTRRVGKRPFQYREGFDPADESAEESKPFKPRGPREYKPRAPQRCMLCTKARGVDVYKAGHECPLK